MQVSCGLHVNDDGLCVWGRTVAAKSCLASADCSIILKAPKHGMQLTTHSGVGQWRKHEVRWLQCFAESLQQRCKWCKNCVFQPGWLSLSNSY